MIKFLFLIIIAHSLVFAENIYIAQESSGSDDGSSAANAHAITWLNTAGNWGTGAGYISPGDTVRLCGTLTSRMQILGSGTPDKWIVILFEPGAQFTAPYWTNTDAIYSNVDISYIVIDGGHTGFSWDSGPSWKPNITSTDNGTSLTNQQSDPRGIQLMSTHHIVVKNMSITNGYVRDAYSTDSYDGGAAIQIRTTSDLLIRNNYCKHFESVIYPISQGTDVYNMLIDSNFCEYFSNGVYGLNGSGTGTILHGPKVFRNKLNPMDIWCGGPHHNDGIQTINVNCITRGLEIAYNLIGPDFGTDGDFNGAIFIEDYTYKTRIYNNIIRCKVGDVMSNGGIIASGGIGFTEGDTVAVVTNNTILQGAANSGIATSNSYIKGNIVINAGYCIATSSSKQAYTNLDSNVYFGTEPYLDGRYYDKDIGIYNRFYLATATPNWQAAGWDLNSLISKTGINEITGDIDENFSGIRLSPNMSVYSEYFTYDDDFYGNKRPATGNWTVGAVEYKIQTKRRSHAFFDR